MNKRSFFPALIIASAALVVACTDDEGTVGGACYPNGTCDGSLVCRSNLCVSPNNSSPNEGMGGGSGGDSSTGVDINACLECGLEECAEGSGSCGKGSACADALTCQLNCGADAACITGCSTDALTTEDVQSLANFAGCLTTSTCTEACTPKIDVGTGTGGGAQTNTGGTSGGGDGNGCERVTPSVACESVSAFVLQEEGTGFVRVDDALSKLDVSEFDTTAEWILNAGQMGVLRYDFSLPLDPPSVDLTNPRGIDSATVETADGVSGCSYSVREAGFLTRQITYVLDEFGGTVFDEFGDPVVAWNGCWGDFAGFGEFDHPSTGTVLNLRTSVASSTAAEEIVVTGLSL